MKQTAVEFIFEELENRENGLPYFTIEQIYKKAKEMEKQHIIDAYQQGFNNAYFSNPLSKEQYYNETFKNK